MLLLSWTRNNLTVTFYLPFLMTLSTVPISRIPNPIGPSPLTDSFFMTILFTSLTLMTFSSASYATSMTTSFLDILAKTKWLISSTMIIPGLDSVNLLRNIVSLALSVSVLNPSVTNPMGCWNNFPSQNVPGTLSLWTSLKPSWLLQVAIQSWWLLTDCPNKAFSSWLPFIVLPKILPSSLLCMCFLSTGSQNTWPLTVNKTGCVIKK